MEHKTMTFYAILSIQVLSTGSMATKVSVRRPSLPPLILSILKGGLVRGAGLNSNTVVASKVHYLKYRRNILLHMYNMYANRIEK